MKSLFFQITCLIVFGLVIGSCDKREDYFLLNNENIKGGVVLNNSHSVFSSSINGNNVIDTIKLNNPFKFSMFLEDENDYVNMNWIGDGSLKFNSSNLPKSVLNSIPTGVIHNFEWDIDSVGTYSFELVFIDAYDKETSYTFTVVVFDNRKPDISWTLTNVGDLDDYDYQFYVEGIDGDALWGGSILYYEFVINGDTTYYPWHDMGYVFPGAGNYFISVRCMDSDNEWSNTVTQANYEIQ